MAYISARAGEIESFRAAMAKQQTGDWSASGGPSCPKEDVAARDLAVAAVPRRSLESGERVHWSGRRVSQLYPGILVYGRVHQCIRPRCPRHRRLHSSHLFLYIPFFSTGIAADYTRAAPPAGGSNNSKLEPRALAKHSANAPRRANPLNFFKKTRPNFLKSDTLIIS